MRLTPKGMMGTRPRNFHSIVTLDRALIGRLNRYLQEKESFLGSNLVRCIEPLAGKSLPPTLPFSSDSGLKLSDAAETFANQVRYVTSSKEPIVAKDDWEACCQKINFSFWEYVDVLQGCVVELFQQISQLSFDVWSVELQEVIQAVVENLIKKFDSLYWVICRLDELLWQYRGGWRGLLFWRTLIDPSLISSVKRSRKDLKRRYGHFAYRLEGLLKVKENVKKSLVKFREYQVFSHLEAGDQEKIKKIYELLKIRECNQKDSIVALGEISRELRTISKVDQVNHLANLWKQALFEKLFELSRAIKEDRQTELANVTEISSFIREAHTLGAFINRYRNFFLSSHPNPYIRARFGFSEWIVAPEPAGTKDLLSTLYDVEKVNALFESFKEGVLQGPTGREILELAKLNRSVDKLLHEMSQPLIAHPLMQKKTLELVQKLQEMRELTSFSKDAIVYVGQGLCRALRNDWRYQTVFDLPEFHEVFAIHQGIVGEVDDRKARGRKMGLQMILKKIISWFKGHQAYRHLLEIEQDMSDIKGNLQDFLGQLQNEIGRLEDATCAAEIVDRYSKELLQYRYLFGKFFHELLQHGTEGKGVRRQFLFVDQYFEAVELLLQEMAEEFKLG
jgi:hypothetical protein